MEATNQDPVSIDAKNPKSDVVANYISLEKFNSNSTSEHPFHSTPKSVQPPFKQRPIHPG